MQQGLHNTKMKPAVEKDVRCVSKQMVPVSREWGCGLSSPPRPVISSAVLCNDASLKTSPATSGPCFHLAVPELYPLQEMVK